MDVTPCRSLSASVVVHLVQPVKNKRRCVNTVTSLTIYTNNDDIDDSSAAGPESKIAGDGSRCRLLSQACMRGRGRKTDCVYIECWGRQSNTSPQVEDVGRVQTYSTSDRICLGCDGFSQLENRLVSGYIKVPG